MNWRYRYLAIFLIIGLFSLYHYFKNNSKKEIQTLEAQKLKYSKPAVPFKPNPNFKNPGSH